VRLKAGTNVANVYYTSLTPGVKFAP
jgi:hypothetical protein